MIAHILTKNNEKTIQKTIESLVHCDEIVINDLGSKDNTKQIAKPHRLILSPEKPRNEARNESAKTKGLNLMIEPWEIVVKGHKPDFKGKYGYVSIIENNTIRKEVRYWRNSATFINPAFEKIDTEEAEFTETMIYSFGRNDLDDLELIVNKWKSDNITAIAPHYYYASIMLMKGDWDAFMKASEHYMFLDKSQSMSAIMNKYYYALASLIHKKEYKPTLQNINLCLCKAPLMAEFWCLQADVYYHLLKKFDVAKSFYENAIIMGSQRLKKDVWPMEISKYKEYPTKMINSCSKIMKASDFYSKSQNDH